MGDLVVVVPGISGSALRDGDGEIWNLSVAAVARGIAHTTATLQRMRLPDGLGDDEPDAAHQLTPTGLIQGIHLFPGLWVGSGYGRLVRRLPGPVVPFAYDWRLSNRLTARRLASAVEPALERWRAESGDADAQVVFVCHSMGGLVARYYLDRLGGAEITRRLITIGTPFSGSVKAIRALTGGLVPLLGRLDATLVDVARSFPSVHQLLPSYRCVDRIGRDPVTLADGHLPDVPSSAVADRMALAEELRTPDRPYEEAWFAGKRQPTDQSVTVGPSGLRFNRIQRGTDHMGDGTVAAFSSIPEAVPSSAAGIYIAARHARLQMHKDLLDLVADKVAAVDYGAVLAPTVELSLDLPDLVSAGVPTPTTVTADQPHLFLQASVSAPDGTVHDAHIPVEPAGDGTYSTNLTLPPGTWLVEVETVDDPLPGRIADLVLAVRPSPK